MGALIPWVDAATPPTLAQAKQARSLGYVACGIYLPGVPNTDPANTWTVAQKEILDEAHMMATPIVVPKPDLTGDPVQTANFAYAMAGIFGLKPKLSVLYSGNHLERTGQISGPLWLPIPGPAPNAVGAQSAIQWGQTSIGGWWVDVSSAAPDFPFVGGLVVDFEHNTADGLDGVEWYRAFQAQIAVLAKVPPPRPAPPPMKRGPTMIVVDSVPPGATDPGAYLLTETGVSHVPDIADLAALMTMLGQNATGRQTLSYDLLTELNGGQGP